MQAIQEPAGQDLSALHDVVVPEPVSWMPATIGWAVLAALLVAVAAILGWRSWRRWKANAYRREALAALDYLRDAGHGNGPTIGQVSALLKRTSLAAYPRARVAELSGAAWTEFLNSTCARSPFQGYAEVALRSLEYAPAAPVDPAADPDALLDAAASWIRHHRAEGV